MKRSKKIALVLFVGSPCLCCFGGFFWVQWKVSSVGGDLPRQLEIARKNGLMTEPEDLYRHVPPEQNAALPYTKAVRLSEHGGPLEADVGAVMAALNRAPKPEQLSAAREAYPKLAPLFAEIEKGADLPHLEYPRDWKQGFAIMFPEFATIKQHAKLLSYKADLQSRNGDWKGALQSVARMERMSRQASEDPILISMLVGIALEQIAIARLNHVIAQHSKNPQALAEAQKVVREFGPLPNFRYYLNGEMVLGRVGIQQLGHTPVGQLMGDTDGDRDSKLLEFLSSNPSMRRAFEAKAVEAYNWQLLRLPKDPAKWEEAARIGEEADRRVQADSSVFNLMNRILFPVFSQAPLSVGRVLASRRLAECSIRIFQIRNTTGSLPTKLPDFGDVSTDPFSGKPFVYKRSGQGFILYSVGDDRHDDGGQETSMNGRRDIVAKMK